MRRTWFYGRLTSRHDGVLLVICPRRGAGVGLRTLLAKFLINIDPNTQVLTRQGFHEMLVDVLGDRVNTVLADTLFEFFDDSGDGQVDAVELTSGLLALTRHGTFCVLTRPIVSDDAVSVSS